MSQQRRYSKVDGTDIQAKTFTNWINVHLKNRNVKIDNVLTDLQDGKILLILLSELSAKIGPTSDSSLPSLNPENQDSRIHHIANVEKALKFIDDILNVKTNSMNISAEDIVDGNQKITMGLVWFLILRLDISRVLGQFRKDSENGNSHDNQPFDARSILIDWVKSQLGALPLTLDNWKNGSIFIALLNSVQPGLFPEKYSDNFSSDLGRISNILTTADDELNIPPLFDPFDFLQMPKVDEMIILPYVASIYQIWKLSISQSSSRRNSLDVAEIINEQSDIDVSLLQVMNVIQAKLEKLQSSQEKSTRTENLLRQLNSLQLIIMQLQSLFSEVYRFLQMSTNDPLRVFLSEISIEILPSVKDHIFETNMQQLDLETAFLSLQGKQRTILKDIQELLSNVREKAFLSLLSFVNKVQSRIGENIQNLSNSMLFSRQMLIFLSTFADLIAPFEISIESLDIGDIQELVSKMNSNLKSFQSQLTLHEETLSKLNDLSIDLDYHNFFNVSIPEHMNSQIEAAERQIAILERTLKRRQSVMELEMMDAFFERLGFDIENFRAEIIRIEKDINDIPIPEVTLKNSEDINTWLSDILKYLETVESRASSVEEKLLKKTFELENQTFSNSLDMNIFSKYEFLVNAVKSLQKRLDSLFSMTANGRKASYEYIEQVTLFLDRNTNVSSRIQRAVSVSQLQDIETDLNALSLTIEPPSSDLTAKLYRTAAQTETDVLKSTMKTFQTILDEKKEEEHMLMRRRSEEAIANKIEFIAKDIENLQTKLEAGIFNDKAAQGSSSEIQYIDDEFRSLENDCHLCDNGDLRVNFESLRKKHYHLHQVSALALFNHKSLSMANSLKKLIINLENIEEYEDISASKSKWIHILESVEKFLEEKLPTDANELIVAHVNNNLNSTLELFSKCNSLVTVIELVMGEFKEKSTLLSKSLEKLRPCKTEMVILEQMLKREILKFTSSDFTIEICETALRNTEAFTDIDIDLSKFAVFPKLLSAISKELMEYSAKIKDTRTIATSLEHLVKFARHWFVHFNSFTSAVELFNSEKMMSLEECENFQIPDIPDLSESSPELAKECASWIAKKVDELEMLKSKRLQQLQEIKNSNMIQLSTLTETVEEIKSLVPCSKDIFINPKASLSTIENCNSSIDEVLSELGQIWSEQKDLANEGFIALRDRIIDLCSFLKRTVFDCRNLCRIAIKLLEISQELDELEKTDDLDPEDILHGLDFVQTRLGRVEVSDNYGETLKTQLVIRISYLIKTNEQRVQKINFDKTMNDVFARLEKIQVQCNSFDEIFSDVDYNWKTLLKFISEPSDSINRHTIFISTLSKLTVSLDDERPKKLLAVLENLERVIGLEFEADSASNCFTMINDLRQRLDLVVDCIHKHSAILPLIEDFLNFVKADNELQICMEALRASIVTSSANAESNSFEHLSAQLRSLDNIISALQNLCDVHGTVKENEYRSIKILDYMQNAMVQTRAERDKLEEIIVETENRSSKFKLSFKYADEFLTIRKEFHDIRLDIEKAFTGNSLSEFKIQSKLKHLQRRLHSIKSSEDYPKHDIDLQDSIAALEKDLDGLSLRLSAHISHTQRETRRKTCSKIIAECKKLLLKLQDAAVITPDRTFNGIREYSRKVALLRVMVRVYEPSVLRLLSMLQKEIEDEINDFEMCNSTIKEKEKLQKVWNSLCDKVLKMDIECRIPIRNELKHFQKSKHRLIYGVREKSSKLPVYVGNSPSPKNNFLKGFDNLDESPADVTLTSPMMKSPSQSKGLIFEGAEKWDELDRAVVHVLDECPFRIQIKKLSDKPMRNMGGGYYEITDFNATNSKKIYCEQRGQDVITRVGGGWEQLGEFLLSRYFLSFQ